MTIVGVVGTVKQYGLDIDGRIVVYRPSRGLLGITSPGRRGDPAPRSAAHRAEDPRDRSDDSGLRRPDDVGPDERLAGAAAVLDDHAGRVRGVRAGSGVVGVYGVMSHLVTQGAHDIGVRMALGAQRSRIV